MLDDAVALRAGLVAWKLHDRFVDRQALSKALRDNWDRRIGGTKFGGVWSLSKARTNPRHPASINALAIGRSNWKKGIVTVEHAIPVDVLFDRFLDASSRDDMTDLIEAYHVAVVTTEEDKNLTKAGLRKQMPQGWSWGDDPLARWQQVGIVVERS